MDILFGILLFLKIADPENLEFIQKTKENNEKYDCEFVYKGFSKPIDIPAITIAGYTFMKQFCDLD